METQTIKAVLDYIIFKNEETHYLVGSFSETETYHTFIAAGTMIDSQEDQEYELIGQYHNHPRYGMQFQIHSAQKVLPKLEGSILRFLTGPDFPTIGKKTAQLIYDTIGEDCLQRIKEDPTILDSIPSLNEKKKEIIRSGIKEFDQYNEQFIQLLNYGLDVSKIQLLQNNYDDPLSVIQSDCFRPYYEVYGFGYRSALKLADGMQLGKKDPRRMDAYVYELVRQMIFASGNTFIHRLNLAQKIPQCAPELLDEILERLMQHPDFTMVEDRIYSYGLHVEESDIAQRLKIHCFPVETISKEDLEEQFDEVQFKFGIEYDVQQKKAIETFFHSSFCILNGGPGTGKTTTVKAILELIHIFYPEAKVKLCAPTGKASKRLSQLAYGESKTIHSLLKWNKDNNTFAQNEEDLIDVDFLIIDEFSMVDTHLFDSLLKAIPDTTRILLIGDENQLESIGPGKVFQDLIDSHLFSMIHLEKIFRQKNGSGIVTLAKEIRDDASCTYEEGVVFEQRETPEILTTIQELISGQDPDDFQILAPMYKGAAGIDRINDVLQNVLNPVSEQKEELRVGTTIFREEDKVMLLKNLPEDDVYNGDIGRILTIHKTQKGEKCISVDFGDRVVDFTTDFLYYLKHAYCISVHKAQGSEYDTVFVIVDSNARHMMDKRLLYTAISRAKKQLYIVGQRKIFESHVRLKERKIRQTTLKEQLYDHFKK